MRAAIYSRFSTDKQTESSIADQVRLCTERAGKDGWTITHRFEDQGISGAAIGNRPGFQQMMTAGLAREFDILLVMDLSRLSRSQADLPKMVDRLTARGARVIGVQDGYDSSRKGHKMQLGISGVFGEMFRESVSDKTFAALESRAKAGRPTGGRPFGYTSKLEVVETEAAIVREIFERFAQGETYRAIARDLNERGAPSPRGRKWIVAAMHALVHNERYLGRLVWKRTVWRKDPDSGKRICVERPEAEWIVHTDESLRLVSDETWARVRMRDAPRESPTATRRKYPLSGLLICGECGRSMTLSGGINARGFGSRRYVCPNYREHLGCSNGISVSRAVAEEFLIEPLRERLLNDQNFLDALSALQKNAPQKSEPENWLGVSEPDGAHRDPISGCPSSQSAHMAVPWGGRVAATGDGHDALLATRLAAIESAAAIGALSRREAASRCAALRAEHERCIRPHAATDATSIQANVERLRAALVSAATDALRDALRRTLGTVRLKPVTDDGPPYLSAVLEGGDIALLEWLALGDKAGRPGLSTLVAGAGFEIYFPPRTLKIRLR